MERRDSCVSDETWALNVLRKIPMSGPGHPVASVELVLTLSILLNINRFNAELCDDVSLNN